MKLHIAEIKTDSRIRVDLGDITELAASLTTYGLLQPPLVHLASDGYHLDDGFRRLTAMKSLGWTEAEFYVTGELTPLQHRQIELEANFKRKDMTWQERCLGYLELHRLNTTATFGWKKELLAECLGKSLGHVGECLQVAKYLEQAIGKDDAFSKALWTKTSFTEAVQYLLGKNVELAQGELERRRQLIFSNPQQAAELLTRQTSASATAPQSEPVVPAEKAEPKTVVIFNEGSDGDCACAIGILPSNYTDSFIKEVMDSLSPSGAAVFWTMADIGLIPRLAAMGIGHSCLPLVWNKGNGLVIPGTPFLSSYTYGILAFNPAYKPKPDFSPVGSIITAFDDGSGLPIALLQHCLDALTHEEDKVFLFDGKTRPTAVAMCARTPVFSGIDEELVLELRDYYLYIYLQNVKFV